MFKKPSGAGSGERMVDSGFVEREVFKGGLVINGASVASGGEFHDGIAKVGIIGEDGGFDRGGAAIEGEFRGVEINDATGGFKKFKNSIRQEDAKRGKDAEGVGMSLL